MQNPRMVYRTELSIKCKDMFTRGPKCSLCGDRPSRNKLTVADRFPSTVAHLCQFCNYKYFPMTIPIHIPEKQWGKFVIATQKKRLWDKYLEDSRC